MVKGYVVGPEGEPVESALFVLDSVAYVANEKGEVEVPPGSYDVTIMHRNYKTQKGRIIIERDFTLILEKEF